MPQDKSAALKDWARKVKGGAQAPSSEPMGPPTDFNTWSPEQIARYDRAVKYLEIAHQVAAGYGRDNPEAMAIYQNVKAKGIGANEARVLGQFQAWRTGTQAAPVDDAQLATQGMSPEQIAEAHKQTAQTNQRIDSKFSIFARPDTVDVKETAPKKAPPKPKPVAPVPPPVAAPPAVAGAEGAPAALPAGVPTAPTVPAPITPGPLVAPAPVMMSGGVPLPPVAAPPPPDPLKQRLAMAETGGI
jgi:hypothetical protein